MLRAKFAYDVRHVVRVHHANVVRTCRARSAQQAVLLLDPSGNLKNGVFVKSFHAMLPLKYFLNGYKNLIRV
jgi:hypothetical protein